MRSEPLLIGIAGALAAGTWAVQTGWERYELVGGELLEDGGFDRGLSAWQAGTYDGQLVADGGAALFTVDEPCPAATCGAMLQQEVARPASEAVVLQVTASTDGVGGPSSSVALLHVMLLPRSADGASLWDESSAVIAIGETTPTATTSRGFALQPGWASLSVVSQLRAKEGSARIEALSLRAAEPLPSWRRAVAGLTAGWAAASVWATLGVLQTPGTRWRAVFLAVCALGLVTLLMPARIVDTAVDDVVAGLSGMSAPDPVVPDEIVAIAPAAEAAPAEAAPGIIEEDDPVRGALREAMPHFGLFVLIAALGGLAFPGSTVAVGVRLLGFAGISEVLQLFTPDRGPALDDVAADAAGCLVGLVLARALTTLRRPRLR